MRQWACYPQTAIVFPLHLPEGVIRLPHTAMLLLLHLDRIALFAALSSQDWSRFPHDASRPILLSGTPSIGSPTSPYAGSRSPNSELRRVLDGWSTAAADSSEAGAPADHPGLVASNTKATVATTTRVETTCVVWGISMFCRFVIVQRSCTQRMNYLYIKHWENIYKTSPCFIPQNKMRERYSSKNCAALFQKWSQFFRKRFNQLFAYSFSKWLAVSWFSF